MADRSTAPDTFRCNRPAALFFDVDGTLVDSKNSIESDGDLTECGPSPAIVDAFRRMRDRGHKTFICTGRTLNLVPASLYELGSTGIISGAGATVSIDDEIRFRKQIPVEVVREAMSRLRSAGVEFILEGDAVCVAIMNYGATYTAIEGILTAHSWEELSGLVPDLGFAKLTLSNEHVSLLKREGDFFFEYFDSADLGMGITELTMRGVTKGTGIRHALELLGPGRWLTFGFGDSENDLPMLDEVDIPVAMGNALTSVRDRSMFVTVPVEEDGVVVALERFGLI